MPKGVDEKKWSKAKKLAKKSGKGKNYAYIMGIYKKMKGGKFNEKFDQIMEAFKVPVTESFDREEWENITSENITKKFAKELDIYDENEVVKALKTAKLIANRDGYTNNWSIIKSITANILGIKVPPHKNKNYINITKNSINSYTVKFNNEHVGHLNFGQLDNFIDDYDEVSVDYISQGDRNRIVSIETDADIDEIKRSVHQAQTNEDDQLSLF